MVGKLAEEVKELRSDRQVQKENYQRLEKFIVRALAEEIREFSQDKKAVVETKVRLVAEARTKLDQLQKRFIEQSARLVKESVSMKLGAELTQLREDIQQARENMFGRRIYEAFASEFSLTHLNENRELAKLKQVIEQQEQQLAEAAQAKVEAERIVESKEREIRVIKEGQGRRAVIDELLGTLVKEKQAVMRELLESVQTPKLKTAFEKYLPAVLNTGVRKEEKSIIAESRSEVTGDKTAKSAAAQETATENNVVELKRLAGLK